MTIHAVENIDIYTRLSISVATGGKHGKRRGEVAIGFYTVFRGLGIKRGNGT